MTDAPKSWQTLIDDLAKPPAPEHAKGPWNGKYLAPYQWRSERVNIEPIAPRITDLDYEAYMSSIEHIRRSYGTGHFPNSNITLDEASLDTHECWNHFGRGTAFLYAALTPQRDQELGCVYLLPPAHDQNPFETLLHLWVIESELASDLDQHLLAIMTSWIAKEWDFDRVIHVVPRSYERGQQVAKSAGFRQVERKDQPQNYACFAWDSPNAKKRDAQ